MEEDRGKKWKCAWCTFPNFPSKSVCYKCNRTRVVVRKPPPVSVAPPRVPERPVTEVHVAADDVPITPLVELLSQNRPKNRKYLVKCRVTGFLPADIRHFTQQDDKGEWRYLVQLTLSDGSVSLPALVCDPLFFGVPPCDLFVNSGSCEILIRKMDRLCCATSGRAKIALQSYVPHGREERVFQVFGTTLI